MLADFYGDKPLIGKKRMTLASLLKEEGYETACIGKWHVGLSWTTIQYPDTVLKLNQTLERIKKQTGDEN